MGKDCRGARAHDDRDMELREISRLDRDTDDASEKAGDNALCC